MSAPNADSSVVGTQSQPMNRISAIFHHRSVARTHIRARNRPVRLTHEPGADARSRAAARRAPAGIRRRGCRPFLPLDQPNTGMPFAQRVIATTAANGTRNPTTANNQFNAPKSAIEESAQ